MNESNQQQTATFQIPIVIPPELAEVTKALIDLQRNLREEIEFYRKHREKNVFSEREAAEFFGISLKSMRELRNAGKINYTVVKGQFFYLRKFLEEHIEREQAFGKAANKK